MKSFYKDPADRNHLCTSGVIVRNGKVLLGNRVYSDANMWVGPGGRCDDGESPEEAVLREVREEVGVTDARIVRKLGEKDGAAGKDRVIVFEIATEQEPKLMEPEKFKEWRWFGIDEIPENLPTSEDRSFFAKALASNA